MAELGEMMHYNISELVKFFHSFPHYNLQFEAIDSEFNPEDSSYLESLILIAAVPVLWMLLWILIYVAYFCYFCVTCRKRRAEKSSRSAQPSRWFSFFFYIVVILALTVSFYSNEVIDSNVKAAQSSLHKIQNDTGKIQIQSAVILRSIDMLKDDTAVSLNKTFLTSRSLDNTDRPLLKGHVEKLVEVLGYARGIVKSAIQTPLTQLDVKQAFSYKDMQKYEMYRHIATHAVSGFVILVTGLSLCSLGCKRKGFILTCVALAVLNLMLVWVGVGAYSALSVATADFCMDPTAYLLKHLPKGDDSKPEASIILDYYLKCQPRANPFYEPVILVQEHLYAAADTIQDMNQSAGKLGSAVAHNLTTAQNEIQAILVKLLKLSSFTECSYSHKNYMDAANSICHAAVVGETTVLGSYMLAGTFLIILVFIMHTTARLIGNRRAYFEVDSQDNDYESRDQHNRSDNPLYYRFSQISAADDGSRAGISSSPQPSAPPRSSPPPAYQNHKDFYSTYGHNGTMDSNTRVPVASNDLNRNSNTFRT